VTVPAVPVLGRVRRTVLGVDRKPTGLSDSAERQFLHVLSLKVQLIISTAGVLADIRDSPGARTAGTGTSS
jgi:hypothetical protein